MKKIFLSILFAVILLIPTLVLADSCKPGGFSTTIMSYVGTGTSFCWFCPMFGGLFDAMNNLATGVSKNLSSIFLMIMAVGLLFSIAFKVGKMVTQLQAVDVMQFMTDIFKHLGRAIIATALLLTSLSIFTYLISPVLSMSMNLTGIIMDEGGGRGEVIKANQAINAKLEKSGSSTRLYVGDICDDLKEDMLKPGDSNAEGKAFTKDVRASFLCALRTMSAGLIFGMALGVVIYGLAFTDLIIFFPNIAYALLGGIIALGHLAIFISFPFKLIDAMIRMAFVAALMPLWIILWVFPATVGYTKKAWDMFISSCLIFVCLAVIITLIMTMMQSAIPNREQLIQYLVCGQDKQAADSIPIGGTSLLVTIALCILGWKMLGTATTLASTFTGQMPNLGVGDAISQTTINMGNAVKPYVQAGGRAALDKMGIDANKREKILKGGAVVGAGVLTGGIGAPVAAGTMWAWGKLTSKKAAPKGTFKPTPQTTAGVQTQQSGVQGGPTMPPAGEQAQQQPAPTSPNRPTAQAPQTTPAQSNNQPQPAVPEKTAQQSAVPPAPTQQQSTAEGSAQKPDSTAQQEQQTRASTGQQDAQNSTQNAAVPAETSAAQTSASANKPTVEADKQSGGAGVDKPQTAGGGTTMKDVVENNKETAKDNNAAETRTSGENAGATGSGSAPQGENAGETRGESAQTNNASQNDANESERDKKEDKTPEEDKKDADKLESRISALEGKLESSQRAAENAQSAATGIQGDAAAARDAAQKALEELKRKNNS